MSDDNRMFASDYACIECGEPAVVFWPVVDPDIEAHPYCMACATEAHRRLLIKIFERREENET